MDEIGSRILAATGRPMIMVPKPGLGTRISKR
jgi:hypothetical protein